jgi:triacylglycerol lipase
MVNVRTWQCAGSAALLLAVGCSSILLPVGPDGPFPDPPIDFSRAFELVQIDRDITQNYALTADELRARYKTGEVEADVFSTVFPGDDGETRFMLLTDHGQRRQTLALGGTNTMRQWQIDALTLPSFQEDLGANVHTGWNTLSFLVINTMLPKLRSDYSLTVTGFSLGAAMSAIVSKYLMLAGYPVTEVVTFGQPRVTDMDGIAVFDELPITRFVNDGDPFPHMKQPDSPAAHFGRMVVLYDGAPYAYVPADDPLLQADTRAFNEFAQEEFDFHSENLYVERVAAKVSSPIQVVYRP